MDKNEIASYCNSWDHVRELRKKIVSGDYVMSDMEVLPLSAHQTPATGRLMMTATSSSLFEFPDLPPAQQQQKQSDEPQQLQDQSDDDDEVPPPASRRTTQEEKVKSSFK